MLPIFSIVNTGRKLGDTLSAVADRNKRRHPKHPQRVLMPKSMAILNWFLVLLGASVTAIGWIAFDETADRGDLATRWAFLPFFCVGAVLLLFYYNSYVETYDDHVVYRTWLRRVHRIDYSEITAYRFAAGHGAAGIRVWTIGGRSKYFQLRLFAMAPLIEYVQKNRLENRTKKPRWWR